MRSWWRRPSSSPARHSAWARSLLRFESEAPADAALPAAPPRARRIGPPAVPSAARAAGARRRAQPPKFFASLPRAFLYPFQGNGVILLVAGTVFFYLLGHLPFIGLILTGYLFAYAKSIITSTAEGRKDPPDWPDFGDWKEDILVPYLQLVALVILSFGPAFIIGLWRPGTAAETRIA